jgi:hypothetical protein
MFQKNVVEKMKAQFMFNIFFPKILPLRDAEKYGRARQTTDDMIRRMRFACWITNAKHTQNI